MKQTLIAAFIVLGLAGCATPATTLPAREATTLPTTAAAPTTAPAAIPTTEATTAVAAPEVTIPAEAAASAAVSPLANTNWYLTFLGPLDTPERATQGNSVTFSFGSDGRLTGSTGCNSFATSYAPAENGAIVIGAPTMTKMACADEALAAQEQQILSLLQSAGSFYIEGITLELAGNAGALYLQQQGRFRIQVSEIRANLVTPALWCRCCRTSQAVFGELLQGAEEIPPRPATFDRYLCRDK
ncbi:META domain-containing protein [Candidatus Gracilibacteria bacterium]|nr:META domain-containing protein [Candidatus Gracilibacteria bacterium]